MAQSRLERIGSIFTRIKNLLEHDGIQANAKPLWYDVYEAFPPKYEPHYDRPVLTDTLQPIFYVEDKIRAKFHKEFANFLYFDFFNKNVCKSEKFIEIYKKLKEKNYSEDDQYKAAIESFIKDFLSFELYSKNKQKIDINKVDAPLQKEIKTLLDEIKKNVQIVEEKRIKETKFQFKEKTLSTTSNNELEVNYKPIKFNLEAILSDDNKNK